MLVHAAFSHFFRRCVCAGPGGVFEKSVSRERCCENPSTYVSARTQHNLGVFTLNGPERTLRRPLPPPEDRSSRDRRYRSSRCCPSIFTIYRRRPRLLVHILVVYTYIILLFMYFRFSFSLFSGLHVHTAAVIILRAAVLRTVPPKCATAESVHRRQELVFFREFLFLYFFFFKVNRQLYSLSYTMRDCSLFLSPQRYATDFFFTGNLVPIVKSGGGFR